MPYARISCLCVVVLVCSLSHVDDGLANSNDAVHDGHEAAGDGRDHRVELEYVSEMTVLDAWRTGDIRKMRQRPLLRCCAVCFGLVLSVKWN